MNVAPTTVAEIVPFAEYGEDVLADNVFSGPADATPAWLEGHLGRVTQLPRGRKGLWGALATNVVPPRSGLSAPVDAGRLAPVRRPMFDVEPGLVIDLDVA